MLLTTVQGFFVLFCFVLFLPTSIRWLVGFHAKGDLHGRDVGSFTETQSMAICGLGHLQKRFVSVLHESRKNAGDMCVTVIGTVGGGG